ncbi:polysaccharide deacetylase family protein [Halalkalicoccus sp. NIPERK01]|uniref:polysaccharide deacetylase family protein n=1 Tax=Halalkalicoccus sp. NIPERK01 TaxID=3053469 RepID=UPI00256EDBB8|nr:polysaccharide deacetylase family protein [Halalkalicoccus sp. NIPERK01]MDL5361767.1 polysaccharide deacetylase family protein [Halalkalicoccus sp. NIPERK01]
MTKQHRRTFLTAVGVGTAALAGCIGSLDGTGDDDNDDTGNTTDPNGDDGTDTTPQDVTAPAIADGEVIDDFEEIEWQPMFDHTTVGASDDALVGEGALLVESDADQAGAYRSFSGGLDVAGKQLSFAIKVESPLPARVVVEARAPGQSDRLTSARRIPSEYDGWLRMEVGWTGRRGEPNLGNVYDLLIYVEPDGNSDETIRFALDDLRATESADQGYVVLTFDDGVASQHTTALPMLEERGWPGVAAIIPDSINRPDRLSLEQCRELRDAGWDVSAHPHTALPEMESHQERVDYLQRAYDTIANRIHEEGARHYFAPYNRMDPESMEAVREVFETSFIFGGHPNVAPPTDGHLLSRVNGHDASDLTGMLDLAADYNQVVVTMVHGVGDGDLDDVSEEDFERLLDEIEARDLEVVTVSDLIDG